MQKMPDNHKIARHSFCITADMLVTLKWCLPLFPDNTQRGKCGSWICISVHKSFGMEEVQFFEYSACLPSVFLKFACFLLYRSAPLPPHGESSREYAFAPVALKMLKEHQQNSQYVSGSFRRRSFSGPGALNHIEKAYQLCLGSKDSLRCLTPYVCRRFCKV